jgi:hypothetical protein
MSLLRACTMLPVFLVLTACGGDDSASDSAPGGAPAASSQRGDSEAAADFTADDLAAYERGFAHEIELVKQADAAADSATTADARNEARGRKDESVTIPEGARASGLGDRYADIRETVHTTLRRLDYQGKIDGPTSYDTGTAATPEVREMFTKDHVAALPPDARAAFQARLQALAEQWGSYVRMTAVGG